MRLVLFCSLGPIHMFNILKIRGEFMHCLKIILDKGP
jgi:hypothetical protein